MFPFISMVSGSGLLVAPGHFSSNSSTFFKNRRNSDFSRGKRVMTKCASKQPEEAKLKPEEEK